MACRVLLCLLFVSSLAAAEENVIQKPLLLLPPELQQKLACQSALEDPWKAQNELLKQTFEQNTPSLTTILPPNDLCNNATPVGFGTLLSETCAAARDGSTSCQGSSNAGDIWYVFTAEEDATVAVNTFGSNFDTLLSVHSGCPGSISNEIVCSDDCGGSDSCLTFAAIAGNSYWIRIGGFQRDDGRVNLTISKQGSFGGRITDAETNQGVAGTQVLVYTEEAEFVKSVTANSNGNYVVDGLADGKYIARTFNQAGYVDEVYEDVVCEGLSCTPDGAKLISISGGSFVQVPFALDLGADIRGKVLDSSGNPLDDIEVHIHDLSNVHISTGFTDETGIYETFDGLPAGPYIVLVFNHDGFVDELYDNVPCVRGICSIAQATVVNVSLGEIVNNINIILDIGGRIVGTITNSNTQLPISGVQVLIHDVSGVRLSSASSNEDGEYTSFDGLPTGNYFVRTSNFKHSIDELHDEIVCPSGICSPTSGTVVPLIVGSESQVDFELDTGAVIFGKIKDAATNDPLNGLLVDMYNASGNRIDFEAPDFAGNYSSLVGLPEGTYFLKTLNQRGYLDELYEEIPCVASRCNPLLGTPIFVKPGSNANIDFALSKGSGISGRIVESSNGLPLNDVGVLMFDPSFSLSTFGVTDACGKYTSIHGMLAGKYIVNTDNFFGFIDELYDDVHCFSGCDFSKANPVALNSGERVSNIDFDLSFLLLRDDFQDSQMDWVVKSGDWVEQGNFLQGSINASTNKALAFVPAPWKPSGENGCSRCTFETAAKITGGIGAKLIIHAWRQNSLNRVELSVREDTNKWKLKQLVNGKVEASKSKRFPLDPDTIYRIKIRYDGSKFELMVDDTLVMSLKSATPPAGSAGFGLKNTSGSFDFLVIY
jgi:hypothetical protein